MKWWNCLWNFMKIFVKNFDEKKNHENSRNFSLNFMKCHQLQFLEIFYEISWNFHEILSFSWNLMKFGFNRVLLGSHHLPVPPLIIPEKYILIQVNSYCFLYCVSGGVDEASMIVGVRLVGCYLSESSETPVRARSGD
jgi:hypothetical protein